jgi:hypothetical protein
MKRFVDTELWDKDWFMSLTAKSKLLIKFIWDKCDNAGVWTPNWILASTYIGEKVNPKDLEKLKGQVEILPNGKVFAPGFIFFQYGKLSESCKPHQKIISLLEKHTLLEKYENYQKGIQRVSDTLEDKEKDKEEEKEKDIKGVQGENKFLIMPFESAEFSNAWLAWREYKKTQYKFKYGSVQTEQIALKQLADLARGDELTAIRIIQQSIGNTWKGFFPLNHNQTNGKQATTYDDEIKRRFPNLHQRAV